MKNLVLRAMRSFDESLTGPEYACNQLVVEMISDEPLTDTNELDVRIYSADYQLTGSDSRKFSSRKTPLKIRFQLVSDSFWNESLYHVFIFRNGILLFLQKTSTRNGAEPDWRTYVCIRIRNFSQNSCATPPGGLNCMKGNSRRFPFRNLSDASVYILILLRFFLVCL